jgi:hypothetical protein
LSVPAGAHVTNVGNSSGYLRGLLLSRWPSLFIRQGRSLQRKVEQRARGLFLLGEPLAPDLPADEPRCVGAAFAFRAAAPRAH